MKTRHALRWLMLLVCLAATPLAAQEDHAWEQYLNEVMTADDMGSASWEETYEQLAELAQHPLDLNSATREQLEALPFLSALQVEQIVEYRDRYGPLQSAGELMMIEALGYQERRLLESLTTIREPKQPMLPTLPTLLKNGRHELTATLRIPCYERKGDRNGYLGYPYRHWLRYQFTFHDRVKAGIVGAQDAGEPFFARKNRLGYDYYAPYLELRDMGCLETLVLGSYRVSLGMGLVMNSSFGFGKLALLQNLGRATHSLRAHSSRSEGALQGVGATLNLGKGFHASAFLSYKASDATLNNDSMTVATLLTSGYHRTLTEMDKKHNLHQTTIGANLRYIHEGFKLGVQTVFTHLNRRLQPNTAILYRRHYPQGYDFLNTSVDYAYSRRGFTLSGETALDKRGHVATLNTIGLRFSDELSLTLLQRFYSYRYAALHAQSYSEGGRVQNESGVYAGLSWQPLRGLRLSAYTDFAYFAWARYRVPQSSRTWDHLLQADYEKGDLRLSMRYRLHQQAHRTRLYVDYRPEQGWGFRTQLDGALIENGNREWGAMVSQQMAYTHRWLRLNAGFGYFHTDSYDSRLYLYEPGPLYTYAFSQQQGEGIRYWLMARAAIGRRLNLTLKVGTTNYFDRPVIGSSYQQIDASSQTDIDLQVRWKI